MSWLKSIGGVLGLNQSNSPKYQSYDIDKAMKTGYVGATSDLGTSKLVKNADGSYSMSYESSDADKIRNQGINSILSGINYDPTEASDSYYQQATRLLDKQYNQNKSNLDENLINRGIQVGTEQYNKAMGNLEDSYLGTLSDLANESVFQGQNLINSQINNANALSGGRDIGLLTNMGSTNSLYDNYINQDNSVRNAKASANAKQGAYLLNTAGSLLGSGNVSKIGSLIGLA